MCMSVLLNYMPVKHIYIYAWWPKISEKHIEYPKTRLKHGCVPPSGRWKSNLGRLQEQQVALTSEPTL